MSTIPLSMAHPLTMTAPPAAPFAAAGAGGTGFAAALGAARSADTSIARTAAEQFVSGVFIQPVLAMMRESSMAAGPFAPGDAERRFGPMLDQRLADSITRTARFPLIDRIERQIVDASRLAQPEGA